MQRIPQIYNAVRGGTSGAIRSGVANVQAGDFLKWDNMWKWGLVSAMVSVIMTIINIAQTYAGFERVALVTWATLLLIVTNVVGTWILILLLRLIVRSTDNVPKHIIYTVLVALSFQTLVHTDLDLTKPLAGSEISEVKSLQTSINLGTAIYDPVVRVLTREMNEPVSALMRSEIAQLQERYPDEDGVNALYEDFLCELDYSPHLDKDQQSAYQEEAQKIVQSDESSPTKIRRIGKLMYRVFGRQVVQDLATGTPCR